MAVRTFTSAIAEVTVASTIPLVIMEAADLTAGQADCEEWTAVPWGIMAEAITSVADVAAVGIITLVADVAAVAVITLAKAAKGEADTVWRADVPLRATHIPVPHALLCTTVVIQGIALQRWDAALPAQAAATAWAAVTAKVAVIA